LYSAGYQTILDGDVAGDVMFSGGAFRLNGSVGRNLTVQINDSGENSDDSPTFTAFMPGNVEMMAAGYEIGSLGSVGGESSINVVNHVDGVAEADGRTVVGIAMADWLRTRIGEFVSLLIVGGLLLAIWPNQMRRVEDQIRLRPLHSLGWGLLGFLLFPAIVLLAIFMVILIAALGGAVTLGELLGTILSFGALAIGLAVALFSFVLWLASKAIFGHLLGEQLLDRISPAVLDDRSGALLVLLVGLLVYEVLRAVPLLGALIAIFVVLIGLGAVLAVAFTRAPKPQTRKPAKKRK
jgi:hypothetical protein